MSLAMKKGTTSTIKQQLENSDSSFNNQGGNVIMRPTCFVDLC